VILRYDRDCMRPANKSFGRSERVIKAASERSAAIAISWAADRLIILDNWRLMHARAPKPDNEDLGSRVLERVLVTSNERKFHL
jgi:alpha-ketoglutarate-dependent taurine dioxygenase